MKSVALIAPNGGTGKTTLAVNMAVLAQTTRHRVLLFDLDPQRNLTAWWHSRGAGNPDLIGTDARGLPGLLQAARTDGYDLAVIDTPPAVSFNTAEMARQVDLVLIPLRPSFPDLRAVDSTAQVVLAAKTPALLVLNACRPSRSSAEALSTTEARSALKGAGLPLAPICLAHCRDYPRALRGGEAVTEYAPNSKAAAEMARLWGDVQRKLGVVSRVGVSGSRP